MLSGDKEKLKWDSRFNIALGIASGLSYLHEGCQRRIIHRDIKAANVLLTEDFEPQVSSKYEKDQLRTREAQNTNRRFLQLQGKLKLQDFSDVLLCY